MMGSQSWLVLLLVAVMATLINALVPTPNLIHESNQNKLDKDVPMALNPKYNKMLPELSTNEMDSSNSINRLPKVTTPIPAEAENKVVKSTTNIPLAENPLYNKMLPDVLKQEATESSKTDEESDEDYYANYDDEYYDTFNDESNETNSTEHLNTTATTTTTKTISTTSTTDKLKPKGLTNVPIKGDDKDVPDSTEADDDDDEDDTDDPDTDEDDDDDDDDEDETLKFNDRVPCPRDCVCDRNINSYLVATCSRLDSDVQKFGSDITDVVVVNVEPKYPILLGPEFFVKIGLKHVSSIKISNCTIGYIHPTAFHGLTELYAVNLTRVGLSSIDKDTFAENGRLRLLTISGNDLSVMTDKNSPYVHYMLNAPSVEELDLSNNNIHELLPTSFNKLSNVVFINLAQNNLKKLPEKLFDSVETIEELDLSYNSLSSLPEKIFNKTALAILHLKYNDISSDLKFITPDLQQLDISYCSIKHVNMHMFARAEGITNLNLKGNSIKKVQPEAFLSMRHLLHIDLSFNDLEQVSSLLFFKNTELDVIKLNDNPKLSQLPTDGFQSHNKNDFNVYLFDISNCAIGALGYRTFSTMPQLTRLRMAWNNINNVEKATFSYLRKLNELDLSNNLITRLDELTFLHNNELNTLNLAGNPIRKLSAKLFLPTGNLKTLDVSDCELHTLLSDNAFRKADFKFYDSLRSFNASFNQIKKISKLDVQGFKNLRTLDISNNPLKCNEDFRQVAKWLGKKEVSTGKVPESLAIDTSLTEHLNANQQEWDDLARTVCKRSTELFKSNEDVIEEKKSYPVNEKKLPLVNAKKTKEDLEEDTSLNDDNYDKLDDNDDYNEDDYDEDEDDEEIDLNEKEPLFKDNGIFVHEVNILQETEDKILRNKLRNEEEQVIIERGTIYYTSYRFLWPILIVISSVIILLLVIGKVVSVLMRKRGERYRQAILASKNSIVYQKLSEDVPTPQTPKVHRYAPINQV